MCGVLGIFFFMLFDGLFQRKGKGFIFVWLGIIFFFSRLALYKFWTSMKLGKPHQPLKQSKWSTIASCDSSFRSVPEEHVFFFFTEVSHPFLRIEEYCGWEIMGSFSLHLLASFFQESFSSWRIYKLSAVATATWASH